MNTPLSMADFLAATDSDQQIRVEADLGFGFVRLRSEEAQRRQAIHDIRSSEDIVIELLRNARDAEARHIYMATYKEGNERSIVIIDDGCGIPPALHREIFKPRVTSKLDTMALDKWGVHGRGMALYSITVNAKEAYVIHSAPHHGTALRVTIDTTSLSEKRDQSNYPTLEVTETSTISVRGPKNIIRTTCEFALDTPRIEVFLGSPTEIAATLYQQGCNESRMLDRVFSEDEPHSFATNLAFAQNPSDFQARAESCGLSMSERSARRILDGEIKPLPTILEQLTSLLSQEKPQQAQDEYELAQAIAQGPVSKPTSFSSQDLDHFRDEILKAYKPLADAYYLDPCQKPSIKVSKGVLHIAIPVEKQR